MPGSSTGGCCSSRRGAAHGAHRAQQRPHRPPRGRGRRGGARRPRGARARPRPDRPARRRCTAPSPPPAGSTLPGRCAPDTGTGSSSRRGWGRTPPSPRCRGPPTPARPRHRGRRRGQRIGDDLGNLQVVERSGTCTGSRGRTGLHLRPAAERGRWPRLLRRRPHGGRARSAAARRAARRPRAPDHHGARRGLQLHHHPTQDEPSTSPVGPAEGHDGTDARWAHGGRNEWSGRPGRPLHRSVQHAPPRPVLRSPGRTDGTHLHGPLRRGGHTGASLRPVGTGVTDGR